MAGKEVNLYYCIKKEEEATHYGFFQHIAATHSDFQVHLIREDREGFFQADLVPDIQAKEVFICGPQPMLKSILWQLRRLQIPAFRIHYENFDFG